MDSWPNATPDNLTKNLEGVVGLKQNQIKLNPSRNRSPVAELRRPQLGTHKFHSEPLTPRSFVKRLGVLLNAFHNRCQIGMFSSMPDPATDSLPVSY